MADGFGRNFLLLQGPHGPFFRQLGQLLEQTGAAAMARIAKHKLTKYSGVPRDALCPKPGFVLVIDQTRGDASIEKGAANAQTFNRCWRPQGRSIPPPTSSLKPIQKRSLDTARAISARRLWMTTWNF
ncbi:hypothetical protein N9W18_05495 [Planktomarina sp.]|nr:hypothetical protein [Planktomarina sp.]